MSEKNKRVPALRFPEFRDAGDWVEKKVSQIAELYKGKGISKADIAIDGIQPCIRYGELYTSYGEIIDKVISKTNLLTSDLFLSKKNDVIIPSSGETKIDIATSSCVIHDNIALGGDLNVIRSNQSGIFLSYYFNGVLKYKIAKIAQGDTVVHLYATQLKLLDVEIPSLKEQEKIAACLTSVDEVIAGESRQLERLHSHKKVLLQNLFPGEDQSLPNYRFPEFQNAGDWEEMPLNKVFSIYQGYAFSSNDSTKEGVRWLKIADVGIQRMNNSNPSFLPVHYKEEYKKFLVILDDYVIALTRPILDKKLKIAKVDMTYDGSLLNQRVGKLITKQNIDFVYFQLQTSQLINNIEKNIAGNDPPNLSTQQIGNIRVKIPKKAEQEKIAACLSSVDELIAAQSRKIDLLKKHKKGLMQGLFPEGEPSP